MRLISKSKLKATKANMLKNDCPLQCDKNHCDVCQFSDSNKIVTDHKVKPELYGREMYY